MQLPTAQLGRGGVSPTLWAPQGRRKKYEEELYSQTWKYQRYLLPSWNLATCVTPESQYPCRCSCLVIQFFSGYSWLSFELDRRVLPQIKGYVCFSRRFGFILSDWTKTRCCFHRELRKRTKYPKYITPCYKVRVVVWDTRTTGLKTEIEKDGFGSRKRFRIWKSGGTPLTEIFTK